MFRTVELVGKVFVMNNDRLIYKLTGFNQIDCEDIGFSFNLELVAGYEYINPDYSDTQGYVTNEAFTEDVQWDTFTFYPLSESLEDAISDSGYEVINITDYKIHPFKG